MFLATCLLCAGLLPATSELTLASFSEADSTTLSATLGWEAPLGVSRASGLRAAQPTADKVRRLRIVGGTSLALAGATLGAMAVVFATTDGLDRLIPKVTLGAGAAALITLSTALFLRARGLSQRAATVSIVATPSGVFASFFAHLGSR